MENTFWSEIIESPGEIYDIPEMYDSVEDCENQSLEELLNSNNDF
ncbi:MAG: hypothetical protein SCG72_04840 [Nitrosarchaeum sp.]|nr:hypothetical protein [Nitrosarchaeum sp.]